MRGVAEQILASGREVDLKTKCIPGPLRCNNTTAAEVGRFQGIRNTLPHESMEEYSRRKKNGLLIATLIDSYEQNPQQVRAQLRGKLGLKGKSISVFHFISFFF